jgi:hypothetical protein
LVLADEIPPVDFTNAEDVLTFLETLPDTQRHDFADYAEDAAEIGMQPYIFRSLQGHKKRYPAPPFTSASDEIRLLDLHPGKSEDPLVCTLSAYHLANFPDYVALSYTWGDSMDQRTIQVNEVANFPVTDNVGKVLQRLRHPEEIIRLWIDSICINQSDLKERGAQVSMMDTIYKGASRVIVWLGDHGVDEIVPDEFFGKPLDLQMQGAMDAILWYARPRWWERAWVVQEIVHGQVAEVWFGPFRKPWADFCWEVLGLDVDRSNYTTEREPLDLRRAQRWSSGQERSNVVERFRVMCGLRQRKDLEDLKTDMHLSSVTVETQHQNCGDGRDKVYSILSLIDPEEASLVPPDYTIPINEVYARATFASIVVRGCFDILARRRFFQNNEVVRHLTWAVDFNRIDHGRLYMTYKWDSVQWPGQRADCRATVTLAPDASHLLAGGCQFGRIVDIFRITSLLPEDRTSPALERILEGRLAKIASYENIPYRRLRSSEKPTGTSTQSANNLLYSFVKTRWSKHHQPPASLASISVRDALAHAFELWTNLASAPPSSRTIIHDIHTYWTYAQGAAFDFSFFATIAGFIGLVPGFAKVGDHIALLHGATLPMILRRCRGEGHDFRGQKHKHPEGEHWTFQGFAYVQGTMSGELMKMCEAEDFSEEDFCLV